MILLDCNYHQVPHLLSSALLMPPEAAAAASDAHGIQGRHGSVRPTHGFVSHAEWAPATPFVSHAAVQEVAVAATQEAAAATQEATAATQEAAAATPATRSEAAAPETFQCERALPPAACG